MEELRKKVNKTSRIVDNLIKVVTVISFLLFLVSFYIYKFKAGEIFKDQVVLCDVVLSQGLTQQNPLDNPIHSALLGAKNNCFNNAGRTAEMWGKLAFMAFDISFLLPFVYFGSKKVVKDTHRNIVKVHEFI